MLSIKEWRAMKEQTGPAITTPAQQAEPDDRDWEFYHTKIQGRAKTYLGYFIDEISQKKLNLPRKGFIIQEVMDALGMTVGEVVRSVANIKRALAKKAALEKQAPQTPPPEQAATPAPSVAAKPQAPSPTMATDYNAAAK